MKKHKIDQIRTFEDLRKQRAKLAKKAGVREQKIVGTVAALRGDSTASGILGAGLSSLGISGFEIVSFALPFILKYKGLILNSKVFSKMKHIPKKNLVLAGAGLGLSLGIIGYLFFQKRRNKKPVVEEKTANEWEKTHPELVNDVIF